MPKKVESDDGDEAQLTGNAPIRLFLLLSFILLILHLKLILLLYLKVLLLYLKILLLLYFRVGNSLRGSKGD